MTEKQFYTDGKYVMQKGEVWVVAGGEHSADVIATALNELIEERNKLQFDYNMEVLARQSVEKEKEELKKEKERYKRLSEIRAENINNRILSLREFINNCEDEKVKNALEDLFYSEVKEYDLAKENRELKELGDYFERKKYEYHNKWNLVHLDNINLRKENEKLKQVYQTLKHRHSLLHDECLEAECDRDSLKKDVISLEKENKQLKQELFESKKDYIIETYSNNPVRRDKKLQVLKEEFKERFGDLATYITSDELLFDIINETIEKGNSDN